MDSPTYSASSNKSARIGLRIGSLIGMSWFFCTASCCQSDTLTMRDAISASAAAVAADEQNTYTEYEEYDTPLSPQAEPPVAQDTQAMASPQATAHIQARRAPDHSRSEPGTELPTSPRTIPALPSLPPPSRASGIRLPPPGSDDWQAVDFEAAVKPTPVKKTKKKTKVAM
jgi:hypothetical protein